MLRALLIAIAATLAIATPALAAADQRVQRATAIAEHVFNPDCGELDIVAAPPRDDAPGAAAWAWPGDCTIRVSGRIWYGPWPIFCDTVLHEAGHVAGLEHSDDPRSIMFPWDTPVKVTGRIAGRQVVEWQNIDRRCLDDSRSILRHVYRATEPHVRRAYGQLR